MSGQIILLPALPLAAAGIAIIGVVVAGTATAIAIGRIVDARLEAIRIEIEKEKARLRQWQAFQAEQVQRMADLSARQSAIRQAEQALSFIELQEVKKSTGDKGVTGKGFVSLEMKGPAVFTIEQMQAVMSDITTAMGDLPQAFKDDNSSPFPRLEKQRMRLHKTLEKNKLCSLEELISFKETIAKTFAEYRRQLEMTAKKSQEFDESTDELLDAVLACRYITEDQGHIQSMESIREQLLSMAAAGQFKPGHIDLLRKRFIEIKKAVEEEMNRSAYRFAVTDSLTRNLNEMGYDSVHDFNQVQSASLAQAVISIPGGEQLKIGIQKDNRLAIEVVHKGGADKSALTEEEKAHFLRQEQKWCLDFIELIRHMGREGFTYEISLERLVPDGSISIIVDADDVDSMGQEERERQGMLEEASVQTKSILT